MPFSSTVQEFSLKNLEGNSNLRSCEVNENKLLDYVKEEEAKRNEKSERRRHGIFFELIVDM